MRRGKVIGFLAILFLFVMSSMSALAAFNPRTTAPGINEVYYYNGKYNPYANSFQGECTWYVWGRAYEIMGARPTYAPNSGKDIWGNCAGKYDRGSTPRVGAIACWGASGQSSNGHVAVVEKIENGIVYTSEYNNDFKHHFSYGKMLNMANFQGYVYLYNEPVPPADTEKPVISNVQITDVNKDGYTVTCTVTDNVGIDRVEFPTWNAGQSGGGKDATWLLGTINGNTASVRVNVRDWNNYEGYYFTHVYAYDTNKNDLSVGAEPTYIDRTDPRISNVRIEQIDNTGYTIICEADDNWGVNRVQFPTWTTNNDQDDIMENWWVNPSASGVKDGNTYSYRVNDSDHHFERGYYRTHIYVYDSCGNTAVYCPEDIMIKNTFMAKRSVVYNGNRYSIYEDILDWEQAERKCEELGGHLVTISTLEEEKIVESLLDSGIRANYFIGGTDKESKGHFRWITGEKFVYTKWGNGEPNNYQGSEDYVEILREQKVWNDVNLTDFGNYGRGFILETKAYYDITGISLANSNINLRKKGEQQTIKATISPANASNKTLTWKSSNPSVATVDQNGKVTAVSNGTANITVTTQDGNKTATCKVTVNIPKPAEPTKPVTPDKPSVSATSMKLNKPSLTLYKGKTYTLKATVKPKTYNSGIKWSSSANKYATVSSKGKITAKKYGRTVITAQTKNGKKATCIVNVKERKATKVKLSRKNLTLTVGKKYALKATVYPKNTTDTKKWTINKKGIVKVSSKGVVTGLKKGKCRITLKTSSGKSAYCNVKV
ncbi:Ig-like domain-containing protein, partial [Robinsoniella peoriensis]|uniref:Ig-like domain-containing protein n=1 Tax=Robinsoniella peoriensis TaxID=180332 RepID=UPI0037539EF1